MPDMTVPNTRYDSTISKYDSTKRGFRYCHICMHIYTFYMNNLLMAEYREPDFLEETDYHRGGIDQNRRAAHEISD